jgi:DNA mismatch repair protein MutL
MPSIIRVLDDKTINKIAAGEVIENSASCVKELMENAIDAKATFIEVRIVAGGRKKIEVIDNGIGMNSEDALLSLERHATSKLKTIEDMNVLCSMGFRGEALPSIASISKLRLCSSDGNGASEVTVHGGRLIGQSVISRVKGTTVEVDSLFFNVPARREFQKSTSHDVGEVTRVIIHMALAHSELGFRFVSDQKEIFHLIGQPNLGFLETTRYRIQELYGEELANSLIEVNQELEGHKVRGFISQISSTRSNRLGQHFYVNGRYIESKLISWAIQDGYSTRLPQKRYPLAFLFIEMNPSWVDVNVHPQKKEVRFKDSFTLKKCISQMVDQALQNSVEKREGREFASSGLQDSELEGSEVKVVQEESFFEKEPFFSGASVFDQVHKIKVLEKPAAFSKKEEALDFVPFLVGLFDEYLFVQAKSCRSKLELPQHHLDGILVIHQRRAKERIAFDHLWRHKQRVAVQNLLLPETFEFSRTDFKLIQELLSPLNDLGISIRFLGGCSFIIDGLPAILNTTDARNLMEQLLEEIRAFGFHNEISEEKKKLLAKSIAKSVKLERKIESMSEAESLLVKLFKSDDPLITPRGKPIIKVFDKNDLSKLFN